MTDASTRVGPGASTCVAPHRPIVALLALALLVVLASTARADTTVGLFAPAAPFPSTAARVELTNRLGKALGGTGRVYARASDFAAAVKKGEITIALVDPAYLAHAGGTANVVAASVRNGDPSAAWQLVAKTGTKLADLAGKHVLVPSIGGREADFALDVLFGGELDRSFFGKLDTALDTASALAALGLGKADAVLVPSGGELPANTSAVLTLPALANPVLVVYGSADGAAVAAAATGFKGDGTVAGFRAADSEVVRAIARRFAPPVKRGPFAVPAARLVVGDLVEGRKLEIQRTPATAFAIGPSR